MTVVDNENFIAISENCFLVRKIWKIPNGWHCLLQIKTVFCRLSERVVIFPSLLLRGIGHQQSLSIASCPVHPSLCFIYYKIILFVLFLCFCKLNHFVNAGFCVLF